ncbi:ZIP family metal transporter OS=Afipia felis OX=1035 GN=BN961_02881 PE=4 SV=1 [Afipia felis]
MIVLMSIVSVLGGSALAIVADRNISHREILETCAGTLLFAGLGLLGLALQHFS